jgi:anti-sigma-K factor RskA
MNPPAAHPREDDAAAYAFGAMEPADRVAFLHSMKQDPALAALVDELQQTAASLTLNMPQVAPPVAMRSQVLDRITSTPQDKVHRPAPQATSRFVRHAPILLGWAAGLALVATSVMLWVDRIQTQRQLADARAQFDQAVESGQRASRVAAEAVEQVKTLGTRLSDAEKNAEKLKTQLADSTQANNVLKQQLADSTKAGESLKQDLAQRAKTMDDLTKEVAALTKANDSAKVQIATLQSSVKEYKQGVAVVVWNSEKQEGILKLEKMPPIKAGKDYQLWVVDPSRKTPVNAGVIKVNDRGFARVDFKPALAIERANNFAISVEQAGGAPENQGPIVLLSK